MVQGFARASTCGRSLTGHIIYALYLNPASVEFAEDLPAAGRCKAARAQTYYDTSSTCKHHRFGKIGAP
ncbi:MAG: hypothetical protein J7L16_10125 [Deltaproteobacteria bacterium]|nr:hypothetical protein [Deltaproteobacteria bacterium]